jgi:alkylhydroperoxidase family enzyme
VAPIDLDKANVAGAAAGLPDGWSSFIPNRVTLNNPEVAGRIAKMTMVFGEHPLMDPKLRELILLRIAWITGAPFVWAGHWNTGHVVLGVPAEHLLAVRDPTTYGGYSSAESAALAAVDETLSKGKISDATWKACEEAFGADPAKMVELVALIGTYQMWTGILNSLEIPLDEEIPFWPPDGVAPVPRSA